MRQIDLVTWNRGQLFEFFRTWDYPLFNMCANMDITPLHRALKERGVPLTVGIVYVLARAANDVPEFRYRMRGETVVEHDLVHPSVTILTEDELFSFCYLEYMQDFATFAAAAPERMAQARLASNLTNPPGRDDLLYMTAIPWVSFSSFMHPINIQNLDCIPRFAWGKLFREGATLKMPLSVQAHHALMDGLHMSRYYERVQALTLEPDFVTRPG